MRGGIIDVYPPTTELPLRIDLWGDEIERFTAFDISDQRSVRDVGAELIFGCRELALTEAVRARAATLEALAPWGAGNWERLARGESFDGMESWLPWLHPTEELVTDLLGRRPRWCSSIPVEHGTERANSMTKRTRSADTLASTWGVPETMTSRASRACISHSIGSSPTARLRCCPCRRCPRDPDSPAVTVRGFEPVAGDATRLATQVGALVAERYSVTLCATTDAGAHRLFDLLAQEGIQAMHAPVAESTPGLRIVVAPLVAGFILPNLKLAVLAESDVTGRRAPHRVARAAGASDRRVLRRSRGGRLRGAPPTRCRPIRRCHLAHHCRDHTRLPHPRVPGQRPALPPRRPDRRSDPVHGGRDADAVEDGRGRLATRRPGPAARPGRSHKSWSRSTARASRSTATHSPPTRPGSTSSSRPSPSSRRPTSCAAVVDVKADMESGRPMDRLVCGDVGFGKTEVALRAVFKAVQDGKQAAVLVPTTLLASQHFQTFADRFAPYPVRVELLSRFLSSAQAKTVVRDLAEGSVDVVVGTHRLLANDVVFKDLGLLVVDEEQRFGVTHKEAVKRLAEGVDVLTLTASPIPRTLEMALTGIRDLSMVNTPPADRRPILTYVGESSEAAVSEAIRRELLREGQVFYVHNRVRDIDAVARRISGLVPEARVAIAHGQMDEGSLEQVVLDFWERKYDVLVCTTIIESGIDMPSVNTLVVDRADLLGLGQLHQIRGRVGRANQRAYAYLFHPADRVLSEQAYERLRTIGEHTELGSGFKIAMRDLEIRGAGNLLGADQSGHIAAVGYDLYVRLVAEAVSEARGDTPVVAATVSLDVPGDAHLPTSYVTAEDARLEAYRRLAGATTDAAVADIGAEWLDRFGPLPAPASGLLAVASLRVECLRVGVSEVVVSPARIGGARHPQAKLSPVRLAASAEIRLRRLVPGSTYKEELGQLFVPLADEGRPAEVLVSLLRQLFPMADDDAPAGAVDSGAAKATR